MESQDVEKLYESVLDHYALVRGSNVTDQLLDEDGANILNKTAQGTGQVRMNMTDLSNHTSVNEDQWRRLLVAYSRTEYRAVDADRGSLALLAHMSQAGRDRLARRRVLAWHALLYLLGPKEPILRAVSGTIHAGASGGSMREVRVDRQHLASEFFSPSQRIIITIPIFATESLTIFKNGKARQGRRFSFLRQRSYRALYKQTNPVAPKPKVCSIKPENLFVQCEDGSDAVTAVDIANVTRFLAEIQNAVAFVFANSSNREEPSLLVNVTTSGGATTDMLLLPGLPGHHADSKRQAGVSHNDEDQVRIQSTSNFIIVSTPSEDRAGNYEKIVTLTVQGKQYATSTHLAAPANTTTGVIFNVPETDKAEQVFDSVCRYYPDLQMLDARRLNSSNIVKILFNGTRVPFWVRYRAATYRCKPFRRKTEACTACWQPGHRQDVCPSTQIAPRCHKCGLSSAPDGHRCTPKCILCDGPHLTGSAECPSLLPTSPAAAYVRTGGQLQGSIRHQGGLSASPEQAPLQYCWYAQRHESRRCQETSPGELHTLVAQ
ncbi:hypothetical protein HPB48_008537 [Haemaphysalis longicornis]|uniref:Uncharacterized protein n=1 Tax=Haemaphysalis longicornis TaxID=44386 RepID=A0A9J6GV17_HAELO|nr:hypothetical protein HPB48_008537 [Haemaphysalis longicornis]